MIILSTVLFFTALACIGYIVGTIQEGVDGAGVFYEGGPVVIAVLFLAAGLLLLMACEPPPREAGAHVHCRCPELPLEAVDYWHKVD